MDEKEMNMGAFVLLLIIIVPQVIKEMAESKKEAISIIIVFLTGAVYSIVLGIVLITGNDFLTNPEGNIIDQHSLQFTTFVVMIELSIAIKEFYDKYFVRKITYNKRKGIIYIGLCVVTMIGILIRVSQIL